MPRGTYRGKHLNYIPDNKSFGAFMLSDQMRDPVTQVAKEIAVTASFLAKRDANGKANVHHYADTFEVKEFAPPVEVSGNLRVSVEVFNSDPVALYNEFGNRKSKRHRTLGRAGAIHGEFKPDGGPL